MNAFGGDGSGQGIDLTEPAQFVSLLADLGIDLLCTTCGSCDLDWVEASGRGTVFTYTIARRPTHPAFADRVPYVIAVVELYRRPDALFEAIRSGQRLMAYGAAAGGAFLFLCLIGFVWHAEQRLREQQRQLIDADALAIVGEISAAVAHSIRNPLGSIRSSAELQRELGGDEDGTQTEIMRNVDRVEALVRSMLAYAADMPERGVHTDLAALVSEVAGRFAPDMGWQGKRLELDLSPDLGRVAADPVLLSQILQSLLTNAAEASREGGRVRVTGKREANDVVLEISDNGVGIEPSRMAFIFKPFQTSKPRGLGMGLALAHRVVKRLGGTVEIDSRHHQGTTVRVRLPVQAS